ncbi:hypothetical protein K440DRAFT_617760 [Wilcoxina mikolae CBS 423.85]|nr:hypothetical protein K440DRAFT_617760 [Wilcoxina mikolae CBS 423.85]
MATDVPRPAIRSAGPSAGPVSGIQEHRSHHKPRKFSTFMKRLANLKSSSAGPSSRTSQTPGRSASFSSGSPSSKQCLKMSHPPSLSRASSNGHLSFDVYRNYHSAGSNDSLSASDCDDVDDERRTVQASTKSWGAPSATTATASTFSSPTPSMRSLTTTLTTVQSTAPGSMLNANYNPHPSHHHNPNGPPQMYSAPFDTHHSPAMPGLLHPVSYNAATAHGIWTDNASIITLASSSKRRRRSFDTDASVRALAPSSVFGGSRESLPLSVLSGNFDSGLGGRSVAGERHSLHGSTVGRSADAASVSNGAPGSIMSEISGTGTATGSPLISPILPSRDSLHIGRLSRRGSGWAEPLDGEDSERRSLSVRSASLKDASEGDQVEVMSVRDGSSNVGVWHGVPGKPRTSREHPPE